MTQGEGTIINGAGSQTGSRPVALGRLHADVGRPTDDCTFWYTNEYIPSNGAFNWRPASRSFKFPNCGGDAANDFSIGANPTSLTLDSGGQRHVDDLDHADRLGLGASI